MLKVFLTVSPFVAASIAPGTDGVAQFADAAAARSHAPLVSTQMAIVAANDVFSGEHLLSEAQMRDAAGGTNVGFDLVTVTNTQIDTTINVDDVGVNNADNDAIVRDVNVNNSQNGQISTINVEGNRGITTVFNNTGNGVIFQSNVQLNLFVNQPPSGE